MRDTLRDELLIEIARSHVWNSRNPTFQCPPNTDRMNAKADELEALVKEYKEKKCSKQ